VKSPDKLSTTARADGGQQALKRSAPEQQSPTPSPDNGFPRKPCPTREHSQSTFKGNRANRRPISFKDSTAFVSMGCFFVNSTQTCDVAKKTWLKQTP
jgi:hypothetical protein